MKYWYVEDAGSDELACAPTLSCTMKRNTGNEDVEFYRLLDGLI